MAYLSWCNQEHSWYFQTWCTCQKFKPQSGQKNGGQCQADPPLAPLTLQTSSPWGQWCNQDLHPNHPWVQCRITHEPEDIGPSTCLAQPPDSPSKWSAPAVLHYIKKKKTNKKTWRQRRKEIKGSFWKGSNLFFGTNTVLSKTKRKWFHFCLMPWNMWNPSTGDSPSVVEPLLQTPFTKNLSWSSLK